MSSKPTVFLSYHRQEPDNSLVQELHNQLEAKGIDVFFDLEAPAGQRLRAIIEREIINRQYFLVFLTPRALESQRLTREIDFAITHDRKIIPVISSDLLFDETHVPAQFHGLLEINPIVFDGADFEIAAQKINEIINPLPVSNPRPRRSYSRGVEILVAFLAMIFAFLALYPQPWRDNLLASLGLLVLPTEPSASVSTIVSSLPTPSITVTPDRTLTMDAINTLNVLDQTVTATLWTETPTLDIDATRTQQASTFTAGQTATADAWTDTPTFTPTPTATLTPSDTPTPTLTPTLSPEQLALTPVASNEAWTPVERDFEGVTMVLVPAGCFMMGSSDEQIDYAVNVLDAPRENIQDEKPPHQQCLPPFWIDKTEVTNGQFERFGGQALRPSVWIGVNRPRANVTWSEARDFCILRDAQLPTEPEWEYATRGPDNNIFPWGNTWEPSNAIWNENSNHQTAAVGSLISGASWVGALDLSGNVYEWTSSLFIYPYDDTASSSPYYVLRGGGLDVAFHLRTTNRVGDYPTSHYSNLGFRCVRSYDAVS